MSVGHSIILPKTHTYKLIKRLHFLGINGIGVKIKSVPKYFYTVFGWGDFRGDRKHRVEN